MYYVYLPMYTGVMASIKVWLATLLVFAALHHFLQRAMEGDLNHMLQTADWKLRVTVNLTVTMQKQLSAIIKLSRQVHTKRIPVPGHVLI